MLETIANDFYNRMQGKRLSQNFTAADLCCAGETWKRTGIENEPLQSDSWDALALLCEKILEPVKEEFGAIEITYGFASQALMREIPQHIAPKLDQHVSCELNRNDNLICDRKGAAIDMRVALISSLRLSAWIIDNLPFDRLYFYGDNRPVHVSYGPENSKSIVTMLTNESGRRIPRRVKPDWFND